VAPWISQATELSTPPLPQALYSTSLPMLHTIEQILLPAIESKLSTSHAVIQSGVETSQSEVSAESKDHYSSGALYALVPGSAPIDAYKSLTPMLRFFSVPRGLRAPASSS
jgi:hypothetical protein